MCGKSLESSGKGATDFAVFPDLRFSEKFALWLHTLGELIAHAPCQRQAVSQLFRACKIYNYLIARFL